MRKIFVALSVLLLTFSVKAQIIKRDQVNADNLKKMAGSVYAYEAPIEPLTPAPKGFKPVYLTHFGRHGSRFLDNASNYDRPYNILKEADDAGALTDFGKNVLRRLEIIRAEADQRAGDLTPKGMQQHRDIARRMVENYPELFTNDKIIMARSTTSHRVLVSEYSALMRFCACVPRSGSTMTPATTTSPGCIPRIRPYRPINVRSAQRYRSSTSVTHIRSAL